MGDQSLNDTAFIYHFQISFLLWNASPLLADVLRCHFTHKPQGKSRDSLLPLPVCASSSSWFNFLDCQTHFGIRLVQNPLKLVGTICHTQKPKKNSSSRKYKQTQNKAYWEHKWDSNKKKEMLLPFCSRCLYSKIIAYEYGSSFHQIIFYS